MNNNQTILIVFVALTAIALLTQAGVMLAFFFFAKKSWESVRADFDEFRESAMPLLETSKAFFERVGHIGPKIEPLTTDLVKTMASVQSITADTAEITKKLRAEADTVRASADELIAKFQQQAARVDSMMTSVLDSADKVGDFVQNTVGTPARQMAGIVAAAKAVVENLRHPEPGARRAQGNGSGDHETFI